MNRLLLAVAVVLLLPATLDAATWTVKPDGTGDFPTIQAAVNAASNGDIIQLTDGTFSGAGNVAVSYNGKGITIRSVNGPAATTIDCGGQNGFLFVNQETNAAVLQEVTITSAATGIQCHPGTPKIETCNIIACAIGVEAGVYPNEDPYPASAWLNGCSISSCNIGAQTLEGGTINLINSTVSNCGPGVRAFLGGYINANGSTFTGNTYGVSLGAVGFNSGGSISNCTFTNHIQAAIWNSYPSDATVSNCRFEANHPAIDSYIAEITIDGCTFVNNSAPSYSPNGGAISSHDDGHLTVVNSVFCQNTASGSGGAIYSDNSIHVRGNTFVHNSSGSGAGALHLSGLSATGPVQRNIIAFSTQGPGTMCTSGANPTLTCNDLYGNAGGDAICGTNGGNNISLDPLLCSTTGCTDFGLASDSPCAAANSPCGLQIGARGVMCGPVPVLFQTVTARALENGVQIAWSVEADEAIASFSVLRDGRVVGEIPGGSDGIFVDTGVKPGSSYLYTVTAIAIDGGVFQSQAVEVRTPGAAFELSQNQPNPFNPSTRIAFTLPEAGPVDVTVFDVNGKHVATILNATRPAGRSFVEWAGRDNRGQALGSGIYFCRLTANGAVRTIKMVLMK